MWGSRQDCPLCAEPEGQQGGWPVPHGCAAPYPCPAQPPGQRRVLGNRASVCVCTSASVSVPMYVPRCVCTHPCMRPGAYLLPRLSSESFCGHRRHVHSEQGVCVCACVPECLGPVCFGSGLSTESAQPCRGCPSRRRVRAHLEPCNARVHTPEAGVHTLTMCPTQAHTGAVDGPGGGPDGVQSGFRASVWGVGRGGSWLSLAEPGRCGPGR